MAKAATPTRGTKPTVPILSAPKRAKKTTSPAVANVLRPKAAKPAADGTVQILSMAKDFPLSKLQPYPDNPRRNDKAIEAIRKSLGAFGAINPIIVDQDLRICAGHTRYEAATNMGRKTFPVIVCQFPDDNTFKAYNIADNQTATIASWDPDKLALALVDLDQNGFQPGPMGFTQDNFDKIIREFNASQQTRPPADQIAQPPKEPISKLGDIWILGDHRILCGDATDPKSYKRLMAGEKADLVFTDPPYGVAYESQAQGLGQIKNDRHADNRLAKLLVPAFKNIADFSADHASIYIWHASSTRRDYEYAMTAAALEERQYILWVKDGFVLGHADYHHQVEPCFYCHKAGATGLRFFGDRTESTSWRVRWRLVEGGNIVAIANGVRISAGMGSEIYLTPKAPKTKKTRLIRISPDEVLLLSGADNSQTTTAWQIAREARADYVHPTQKPVELALRAINNSSKGGELVLDPFLGSGTSVIAAEDSGRRCFAMDIDPAFVDVAVQRWAEYTGKDAKRESDGVSWAAAKAKKKRAA